MVTRVNTHLGRQRVTHNAQPWEARYVTAIAEQMRAIRDNLKQVIRSVDNTTPAALKYALQPIFDKSQVYVPVDTGRLKRSGRLRSKRIVTGSSVTLGYGYGGFPPYTARVHERTDFFHPLPTRSKFLEVAINEHLRDIQPRMIQFIQDKTGIKP